MHTWNTRWKLGSWSHSKGTTNGWKTRMYLVTILTEEELTTYTSKLNQLLLKPESQPGSEIINAKRRGKQAFRAHFISFL